MKLGELLRNPEGECSKPGHCTLSLEPTLTKTPTIPIRKSTAQNRSSSPPKPNAPLDFGVKSLDQILKEKANSAGNVPDEAELRLRNQQKSQQFFEELASPTSFALPESNFGEITTQNPPLTAPTLLTISQSSPEKKRKESPALESEPASKRRKTEDSSMSSGQMTQSTEDEFTRRLEAEIKELEEELIDIEGDFDLTDVQLDDAEMAEIEALMQE